MQKTNAKDAAMDMAKALRDVFKKHSLNSRKKAWSALTSKEGEKEMDKIIAHPDRPINTISKLSFREWIQEN